MQNKQKYLEKSDRNTNKTFADLLQKKQKILQGAGEDVKEIIEVAKLQKTDLKKLKYIETVIKYYNQIGYSLQPENIRYNFYFEFIPELISELDKFKKSILFKNNKFDPDKMNNTRLKEIKKFKWKGTEKSITILFECLHNADFISQEDYSSRFRIISDTFKNKYGKDFKQKQLKVSSGKPFTDKDNFDKLINSITKIMKR